MEQERIVEGTQDIEEYMTLPAGKRIGWIGIGFLPIAAGLMWNVGLSIIAAIIVAVQANLAGVELTQEAFLEKMSTGPVAEAVTMGLHLGFVLMFGLAYYFMFVRREKTGNWKKLLHPVRIPAIIVAALATQMGISCALMVILPLMPRVMESYGNLMESLGKPTLLMSLSVCLLAPIGEELLFRGLTLRIMKKGMPVAAAIIVQALFFGIYHMNPVQGTYAFLMGIVLGYIAYKYNSVVPTIFYHMVMNSTNYLMGFVPESLFDNKPLTAAIAVVCIALIIGTTILATRKVSPEPLSKKG